MKTRIQYEAGGAGPEFVRTILEKSVGKTIVGIKFGPEPSHDELVHSDEYLVFEFSDGTSLELQSGSNAGSLHGKYRDAAGTKLKASDLSLSFVANFRERY